MADGAVLVVGGTGVFGARLVGALLDHSGFSVIAAARDAGRLAALRFRHGGNPRLSVLALDATAIMPAMLRDSGAFAVVDAAGPFQGGPTVLARAAIAAGIHYLDLCDARDFAAGFGALDEDARQAGVVALTGASSTPGLSNAALDALTAGWRRIDRIEVAIAPGNNAPRGLAVMQSILAYAGRPVRVFDGGAWGERPGWGMLVRRDMPGLGRRFMSLAETPDLDIIPARFAPRDGAVFRAGLELAVLHLGLAAASLPVRLGLVASLRPLARPFRWIADRLRGLGSDRGGMIVTAEGLDPDDVRQRAEWSLVAEAGDGPVIPVLPALAALRALADGRLSRPGARSCAGELRLDWIEAEFRPWRIATSRRITARPSLYRAVLGDRFAALPAALRRLHDTDGRRSWHGEARIDGADAGLAWLAARLFRLPHGAGGVSVAVTITPAGRGERWVRRFGSSSFASTLSPGRAPASLTERFGPLSFDLGLVTGPDGVDAMPVLGWRIGPVRLPLRLAPVALASERQDEDGRFRFDVEMRLPLGLGRLVRYRGWLEQGS